MTLRLVPRDTPHKLYISTAPFPEVIPEPTRTSRPASTADLTEVRSALAAIPVEQLEYDDWRDMIFGIHHASGGSDEGLQLAHEFSARSPKHDPDFLANEVWPYVRSDREKPITAGKIIHKARGYGWNEDILDDFEVLPDEDNTPPKVDVVLFDPRASRAGDCFSVEPPQPKFIVERHLPVDAGNESAIGGTGKTTRQQWEAIQLINRDTLYGRSILRQGGVLLITNEDDRDTVRWRNYMIGHAMGLSEAERRRVADSFHILDLSGTGERLVQADRSGNLTRTNLAERIIRSYEREGIVLVVFDPLNLFGPGERYVNDGEAAVLDLGRHISRELNACVRFTTHVSKVVGREGIVDAHSGRGGAALGDNARFVHNYLAHEPDHKTYKAPKSAEQAQERGNLYRLHVSKLSGAARPREPIWIERDGFRFIQHVGPAESVDDRQARNEHVLLDFLRQANEAGRRYSPRELEDKLDGSGLELTRKEVRVALIELRASGEVFDEDLPAGERRGARRTYLAARPADLGVDE